MKCPNCGSDMTRTGIETVMDEKKPGESYPEAFRRSAKGEGIAVRSYSCPVCGSQELTSNR